MTTHRINPGISILVLSVGIWTATALADNRAEFDQAYAAYNQHMKANDAKPALAAAKDSLRYGARVFGKDHVNTANLAVNYATLLNDTGDYRNARKALRGKLAILETRYGDNATELVPMCIQLARAAKDPDAALEYLKRVASLSKGYEDNLLEAQKNFDIVLILLRWGGSGLAEPFIDRAYEIYVQRLQPNDFRLGLMSYHKARWAMAKDLHEDAIVYLERALIAFSAPSTGQTIGALELTVRQLLVQTHEKLKQSAAATEHLLILGAHQDWSATADPVFETELPVDVIEERISGAVTVSFTVDEQGFVVNPAVIDSNQQTLSDAALTMVKGFRYTPRFLDGKPVATKGIEYTVSFFLPESPRVASRPRFIRPPIKEMMMPDRNDKSGCFDGGLGQAAKSCEDLPTFKR